MKKWRKIWLKLGRREHVLGFLALIVMFTVIADRWAIRPYLNYREDTEQKLAAKIDLLEKYNIVLAGKKYLLEQMKTANKVKLDMEMRFIIANTEALASAGLQKRIKDVAARSEVTVAKSSSYKGIELFKNRQLKLVPARFEVTADTMSSLSAFLYDIEYGNDKFLFIDELSIRLLDRHRRQGVRGSLKVNAIVRIGGQHDS